MRCPTCGAIAPPPSRFCERDGTRLVAEDATSPAESNDPSAAACACGNTEFDPDGFCTRCGRARPPASRAFDHVEQAPLPELAGISDRGRRHPWNEDALSLGAERLGEAGPEAVHVMVVCDGVSSARDAQHMAQLAAEVTRAHLLESSRTDLAPELAMRQAIAAAHTALMAAPAAPDDTALADPTKSQAPGCTIVAAVVRAGQATVGWVGDSRAYRLDLDPPGCDLLTHDHSWFNEMVDTGRLSPEEAAEAPERNAITRCLGPLGVDAPGEGPEADVVACEVSPGQMLLLCSDGLWKYTEDPAELGALVGEAAARAPLALDISRHLIEFANARGGSDNITAAILKLT
jgi:serine/threonine protein phosphatase PrpC